MSGQAPVYLNDLVQKHRPVRLLRSEFASLLGVRRTKTVTHGRRSFSYSSPHLWNRLPEEIKRCIHYDKAYLLVCKKACFEKCILQNRNKGYRLSSNVFYSVIRYSVLKDMKQQTHNNYWIII